MKWYEMTRDEFMRTIDSFKGPAYYAPKAPPDYSPRDKRIWLRQCLHRDCSAERCADMRPDDGEERDGVYMGRPW